MKSVTQRQLIIHWNDISSVSGTRNIVLHHRCCCCCCCFIGRYRRCYKLALVDSEGRSRAYRCTRRGHCRSLIASRPQTVKLGQRASVVDSAYTVRLILTTAAPRAALHEKRKKKKRTRDGSAAECQIGYMHIGLRFLLANRGRETWLHLGLHAWTAIAAYNEYFVFIFTSTHTRTHKQCSRLLIVRAKLIVNWYGALRNYIIVGSHNLIHFALSIG